MKFKGRDLAAGLQSCEFSGNVCDSPGENKNSPNSENSRSSNSGDYN